MSDLTTQFEFDLIGAGQRPFGGYNSSKDKTDVSPLMMVRGSQNVYKKLSGTISVRPGLKLRGSADSTSAGVNSSYEWYTSLGATIPLRVANSKLQFESDIVTAGTFVWYDLMSSLTLTRFVFDTWWDNTLKKDKSLFVKGDSNIHMWEGGIGLISSTTINTIVLTTTIASSGFSTTSGSVVVNGTTYTYSGSSGSTLTGVGADPTGNANGSVVYSAVVTTATSPASGAVNDFIKVITNQLYVGSYTSRLIYISDDSDYTNFSVPGTRAAGDPELLTLDAAGKGIGLRQGKAHIFAGTSYLHIVTFSQITVGSTLTEQTDAPRQDLANLEGAFAHEFIDTVGDSLIYLSQENQVVSYGSYRNINQPKYPTLSLDVRDELKAEDFTGGHLRCTGEFIYITAPLSGKAYLHQTRERIDPQGNITAERLWHPPQIWNAARIAVIDGVEFVHSNANPQLYQIWDTNQWHDDSPNLADDGTNENLPYTCVAALAYRQFRGRRQGQLSFDKVFFEGYMTEGTTLKFLTLFDYQGATDIQDRVVNSIDKPAKFYTTAAGVSLGDGSLGDNPLGDGIIFSDDAQDLLPKFKAIRGVTSKSSAEFQLIPYSSDIDSHWEILCLGPNAEVDRTQQAVFLRG